MASVSLQEAIRNANPSTGYEPLPLGDYDVVVSNAEYKVVEKSGNPMFKITFTVDDGEELAGRKQYHNITIAETNVDISVGQLETLGADREDIALAVADDDAAKARVAGQLIDSKATIKVVKGTGEYNGRANVNVYINKRKGSGGGARLDDDDKPVTRGKRSTGPKAPF